MKEEGEAGEGRRRRRGEGAGLEARPRNRVEPGRAIQSSRHCRRRGEAEEA